MIGSAIPVVYHLKLEKNETISYHFTIFLLTICKPAFILMIYNPIGKISPDTKILCRRLPSTFYAIEVVRFHKKQIGNC